MFVDTPEFVSALAGRTRSFIPLKKLQLWLDLVEFQWQRWVVRYDESARAGFLDRLFGDTDELIQFAWLLAAFAIVPLFWFAAVAHRSNQRKRNPTFACFARIESKLAKRGIQRSHGETVFQFMQRAARDWPERADELLALAAELNALAYAAPDSTLQRERLAQLQAKARHL